MKKNFIKLTALALTLLLAVPTFTGCKQQEMPPILGGQKEQKERTGATLEIPLEHAYRSEEITHARQWSMMDSVVGNCVYFGKPSQQNRVTVLMEYNTDTGVSREITPACAAEREKATNYVGITEITELEDGKRSLLCEEYYPQLFDSSEIIRRCIEVYDRDWNLLETQEVPGSFAENVNLFNCGTARDADGNYYVSVIDNKTGEKQILTYNSSFEQYGSIPLSPDGFLIGQDFVQGADGRVYMAWMDMERDIVRMFRLSAEDRTMEEIDIAQNVQSMCSGLGEYLYYYHDGNDLYGVTESGEEKVMNFINSNFRKQSVGDIIALPNGKFAMSSFFDTAYTYWLAEARSKDETENLQMLTLAGVGMYDRLVDAVLDFNRSSTTHHILIVDYAESENDAHLKAGLAKMKEDMINGKVADMICTDGLNFESFASKGLFEDWYTLMDADEEFKRSDYFENFFRAYEHNGKLMRLGVDFTVYTQLAKTEHVGEKQGYTIAEFTQLADSLSDRMHPYQYSMFMYDSQSGYVDKQTQKCYIDTPEYIRLMKILNGTEEQQASYTGNEMDFREDRAVFYPCRIAMPIDYHAICRARFGDAPITFTGEPMYALKGNGGQFLTTFTVSVNSQSKHQEAVWDFMKHLLSEDYQKKLGSTMPVHRAALDFYLDNATHMTAATTWFGAGEVNIGAATPEEMTELRTYIEGIEAAYTRDETIKNIMQEEMDMHFAGDQTAEQAAKMMQSRVSIYLSEQS